jgi:hypothetical protein
MFYSSVYFVFPSSCCARRHSTPPPPQLFRKIVCIVGTAPIFPARLNQLVMERSDWCESWLRCHVLTENILSCCLLCGTSWTRNWYSSRPVLASCSQHFYGKLNGKMSSEGRWGKPRYPRRHESRANDPYPVKWGRVTGFSHTLLLLLVVYLTTLSD